VRRVLCIVICYIYIIKNNPDLCRGLCYLPLLRYRATSTSYLPDVLLIRRRGARGGERCGFPVWATGYGRERRDDRLVDWGVVVTAALYVGAGGRR